MSNQGPLAGGLKASLAASAEKHEGRSDIGGIVAQRKAQQERDPKIKLAVTLDRGFHARIKIHAAASYRTIEEIARDALEEYMNKYAS